MSTDRMKKPLYICDPEKNKVCPATHCGYKRRGPEPWCYSTKYPEFAKLDENGKPIRAKMLWEEV